MALDTGSPKTGREIVEALSRLQSQSEDFVDGLPSASSSSLRGTTGPRAITFAI
jgi:hypothetical protein